MDQACRVASPCVVALLRWNIGGWQVRGTSRGLAHQPNPVRGHARPWNSQEQIQRRADLIRPADEHPCPTYATPPDACDHEHQPHGTRHHPEQQGCLPNRESTRKNRLQRPTSALSIEPPSFECQNSSLSKDVRIPVATHIPIKAELLFLFSIASLTAFSYSRIAGYTSCFLRKSKARLTRWLQISGRVSTVFRWSRSPRQSPT